MDMKQITTVSKRCSVVMQGRTLNGMLTTNFFYRCNLPKGHEGPHQTIKDGKPFLFPKQ